MGEAIPRKFRPQRKTVHINLSRLIERACRGEDIVIARRTPPVVRLVALRDEQGNRRPGALKGKLFCSPDVFAPLTDRELKDLGFEQ